MDPVIVYRARSSEADSALVTDTVNQLIYPTLTREGVPLHGDTVPRYRLDKQVTGPDGLISAFDEWTDMFEVGDNVALTHITEDTIVETYKILFAKAIPGDLYARIRARFIEDKTTYDGAIQEIDEAIAREQFEAQRRGVEAKESLGPLPNLAEQLFDAEY